MYDDVAAGKTNNFLHAFVLWNNNVEVLTNRNISDPDVRDATSIKSER
jgi:hypothetical protein